MALPVEDVSFVFDGFAFGGIGGKVIVTGLTINEPEYRDTDTLNPVWLGGWGGRGLVGFGSWEFDLVTNAKDRASAYALHRAMTAKWRAYLARPNPRARLYYRIGDRYGYVVGHPHDISIPTPDVASGAGVAKFNAKFVQTDPLFYDCNPDGSGTGSTVLLLNEIRTGATVLPTVLPMVFGAGGATQARQGQIVNSGSAPSPFKVRIVGPIQQPVISAPSWRLSFPSLTLADGRWVEVDTLAMTSRMDTGAAYWPSADSRLNSRLVPGAQEVMVSGNDPTNTARFEFSWSEGSYSI